MLGLREIGGVTCRAWRGTEWQAISVPRRFFRHERIEAGFDLTPAPRPGVRAQAADPCAEGWHEFRELHPDYAKMQFWTTTLHRLDYANAFCQREPIDVARYMEAIGGTAPDLVASIRSLGELGGGPPPDLGPPDESKE